MRAFSRKPDAPPACIGVIHLPALPGSPLAERSLAEVLKHALIDAAALLDGGVDGLIVENLGDRPYAAETVDASTIADMTRIGVALAERIAAQPRPVLLGINVLRNDPIAAMSIASAVDADFIRVNVHTGAMVTDQGVITGRARETVALRRRLNSRVRIAADVAVKHASPLGHLDLAQTTRDTALRACADAVLVTGSGTGQPIDDKTLALVRSSVPDHPVWAASGVTPATLAALVSSVDAVVVGTWLHRDSDLAAPVDPQRVAAFMTALHAL